MELPEIDLDKFCEDVSAGTNEAAQLPRAIEIFPELVLEVVGGLSNLYLEVYLAKFFSQGIRDEIQITTNDTFASAHVPLVAILQEIDNCAGVGSEQSRMIFRVMQAVFRKHFEDPHNLQEGKRLFFRPLGQFEALDLDRWSYRLWYRDPAADTYSQFLLG